MGKQPTAPPTPGATGCGPTEDTDHRGPRAGSRFYLPLKHPEACFSFGSATPPAAVNMRAEGECGRGWSPSRRPRGPGSPRHPPRTLARVLRERPPASLPFLPLGSGPLSALSPRDSGRVCERRRERWVGFRVPPPAPPQAPTLCLLSPQTCPGSPGAGRCHAPHVFQAPALRRGTRVLLSLCSKARTPSPVSLPAPSASDPAPHGALPRGPRALGTAPSAMPLHPAARTPAA